MTTRRRLIQSIPALPLMTTAGAAALLAACGDKKTVEAPAATTPAPAAPSVAAAPEMAVTPAPAIAAPPSATGPLIDEKDPQAVALSYVAIAAKADKTKFPKYADGQMCSNCSLYQGGAAAQGGCPLFPGKQVLSTAWCSAYNKKAA